MAERVRIYEVGPRDGLQNEATPIPTATKARFIELLADAGLREIEATSVRRARARSRSWPTPTSCIAGLPRAPGVRYPVLVPNVRGLARAEAAGADAIAVFTAATDAFTTAQHRDDGRRVARGVRAGPRACRRPRLVAARLRLDRLRLPVHRRASIRDRAVEVALRLLDLGVDEVCFGDTIGVGVPGQVAALTGLAVEAGIPLERIAFHFHDTRGHGPGQRRGRARRRRPLLRRLDRRDRRLSVRARARPAISPPRTSSTSSTRRAASTASSLDGVLARRPVHRRRARPAARDQGRPGRRLGPGDRRAGRSRLTPPRPERCRGHRVAPRSTLLTLSSAAAAEATSASLLHVPDVSAIVRPMDGVVLVLNQNYEPLNVCNLPRAFRLVFGEKAEVIEYDHQVIRTPRTEYRAPSVIRLQYQIRRPRPRVKLSRREVFARDRHTCQYCGRQVARPDARPRRARAIAAAGTPGRTSSPPASRATTARAARRSTRRGCACSGRRSSRAATSTRCSRRTSPTTATRPGGPTCSWAGTDAAATGRTGGDRGRDPGRRPRRCSRPSGRTATRRTSSAARCATSSSAAPPHDWDLASDALPERVVGAVPGRRLREPVRDGRRPARRRRPSRSRPSGPTTTTPTSGGRTGSSSATRSRLDLARRDFTVNAMAWGAAAGRRRPALVDPYGGLGRRRRAASCGPSATRGARFEEDALRMIRAVRLAATLGFGDRAGDAGRRSRRGPSSSRHLSGERIAAELDKLLAAPSAVGRAAAAEPTPACSRAISPELAAQRGDRRRTRSPGEDLWDHTLRAVDAAPADRPVVRLAALLHDIGKPATFADGHFIGHDAVGAELAGAFLDRLRAAARRARSGRPARPPPHVQLRAELVATPPSGGSSARWRRSARARSRSCSRCARPTTSARAAGRRRAARRAPRRGSRPSSRAERRPRSARRSAIDGDDLIAELGLGAGPLLGRILDELLERVIADPALNERPTLLLLAQAMLAEDR